MRERQWREGEWLRGILGKLLDRLEEAGRQLRGLPVVGGLGMAGTQLCAGLPEVDDKEGCGLGCGTGKMGLGPKVSGPLSFFSFLSVFFSDIYLPMLLKIAKHFYKC